jgi:DNA-binding transcriptional ArsR family regulator
MAVGSKSTANSPAAGAHEPRTAGRFAYAGLERLLHERARLSILSSLAMHSGGLLFNDLKALCALTDGNLSRQLQILQEAQMVDVLKGVRNNRPTTLCRLSPAGRKRFHEYVGELERVVSDATSAAARAPGGAARSVLPPGFSPA